MQVQLFVPCMVDQFYPTTAHHTKKILQHLGCQVYHNPQQTCCGQTSYLAGYKYEAEKLALKWINNTHLFDALVSPTASCLAFIQKQYPSFFLGDSDKSEICRHLKENSFELSDFIVRRLQKKWDGYFPHKVTFHDGCKALRSYGLYEQPRELLRQIEGLELIELNDNHTCCGHGNTFSFSYPQLSASMVKDKVEAALDTGAEFIVSTESSCLWQIEGYLRKKIYPLQTLHLADLLYKSIRKK